MGERQQDDRPGWQQLSMLRGGPVEVILRVGLFPEADHAQFQVEVRDAGSKELRALASRPHVDLSATADELTVWLAAVRSHVEDLTQPF